MRGVQVLDIASSRLTHEHYLPISFYV